MVTACWTSTRTAYVFTVTCDCGASSEASLGDTPDEEDAPPPSAEARRTERAAWAMFLHRARKNRCKQCLDAAGRWLRQESSFVPAKTSPLPGWVELVTAARVGQQRA